MKVLLAAGGDLSRALDDCPKQDGGFSPLTFGWAVRGMPLRQLALGLGWPTTEIDELEQFRDVSSSAWSGLLDPSHGVARAVRDA